MKRVTKDYIDLFLEAADGSEIDDFGAEFARANVSVTLSNVIPFIAAKYSFTF